MWVQLRYLFGGNALGRKRGGPHLLADARRGFFELVAATALALPLLLAAHWLLGHARRAVRRVVLALAGLQVTLLLVMLASALERMRLYREWYSQTQLRFYDDRVHAVAGRAAAPFLLTVLPGSRAGLRARPRWARRSPRWRCAAAPSIPTQSAIVVANRDTPAGFDLE